MPKSKSRVKLSNLAHSESLSEIMEKLRGKTIVARHKNEFGIIKESRPGDGDYEKALACEAGLQVQDKFLKRMRLTRAEALDLIMKKMAGQTFCLEYSNGGGDANRDVEQVSPGHPDYAYALKYEAENWLLGYLSYTLP